MSVKAWKRIITMFVIVLIIILLVLAISGNVKYKKTQAMYDEVIAAESSDTLVDLADYGITDLKDYENAIRYIGSKTKAEPAKYQSKYEDMYVDNDFKCTDDLNEMICYLTFDDGPAGTNTETVLNSLKKYGAHATFFVCYQNTDEARALLKRMVDEGHTIGVHTSTHDYDKIYGSVTAYLKDFNKTYEWVKEVTGVAPEIFRFPGGSVNSYNIGTYQEIISEMTRRGFTYYDWNCSSGDAAASYVKEDRIISNVCNKANVNNKIVLMHDGYGHKTSAEAVGPILKKLSAKGYKFNALTKDVTPVHFDYYKD